MVDGRKRSGTADTPQLARRDRAEAMLRLGDDASDDPTVRDLVDMWLHDVEHAATTAAVRDYAISVIPKAFMTRQVSSVSGPVVASLWREMADAGIGAHTIIKARNALSKSFELGVQYGQAAGNPIRAVKPKAPSEPERITPPTIDDVRTLIGHFAARPTLQSWIRMMAVCGARPGEVCGLRWEDLDAKKATVRVERSVDRYGNITGGKTGKKGHRTVGLDAPTLKAIRRIDRVVGCPWIFTHDGSTPWSPQPTGREVQRAVARLGLSMRTYDLRHFAATQALAAGRTITEVAKMLGDNPATVMRVYAHWTEDTTTAASAVGAALDGAV